MYAFSISLGSSFALYVLGSSITDYCVVVDGLCWRVAEFLQALFLVLLPALPISGAMFFVKDYIFEAWAKFTITFIPIVSVIIFVSSPNSGGFIFPSDRQMAVLFSLAVYSLISLIIIVRAWWRGRAV